jgi:hypothetical protein
MPDVLHRAIQLFEARPLTCLGCLIAAVMYLNLMTSGPRIR